MEPHPWTPALTPPPPLPFSIMFLWDPGSMSWQPPELELLEIDELSDAKFSGIFKLTYDGDFFITLQTKVQVYFCRFLVFGGRPGGGDLGDAVQSLKFPNFCAGKPNQPVTAKGRHRGGEQGDDLSDGIANQELQAAGGADPGGVQAQGSDSVVQE